MQRELGALAEGAGQEQQADPGGDAGADVALLRRCEHAGELERTGDHEDEEHGQREAEVADAVDDEGLLARLTGALLAEPEGDQQVRAEADALPAEEQQQVAVGQDEHEHREHEQVEVGEEAVVALVAVHVADGVVVHHAADDADHQQHDPGERVDLVAPGHVELAGRDPVEGVPDEGRVAVAERPDEPVDAERGGDGDHGHREDVRLPPHALAEQQGHDEPQQRQQRDERDGDLQVSGSLHGPPVSP